MMTQRGFSIIAAIFILVIVSLLGQYLISITGVQRQTSLLALQTSRAYQTANAGIEWGIVRVINGHCAASTTIAPNLDNFTVSVQCENLGNVNENGTTQTVYKVTSHSQFSSYGNVDYVSRRLQVTIHD